MIFFKILIFIFFFLVSNNLFADPLPNCSDDSFLEPTPDNKLNFDLDPDSDDYKISVPGFNCNFYINGTEMWPCGQLVSDVPNPRINCANLSDLPSCLTLEKANTIRQEPNIIPIKPLQNCIRIGDGTSTSIDVDDICVNGDGKIEDINCVNLCYTDDRDDGPANCNPRKYHHYLEDNIGNRVLKRSNPDLSQYSCRKLSDNELFFFSDEFNKPNCANLREINNENQAVIRSTINIDENGDPILDGDGNYTYAPMIDEVNPGINCYYPICNDNFKNIQNSINQNIQNSSDIIDPDDNSKYIALQNCTNDESKAFIASDRIVCNSNDKCYDFTDAQMDLLISSPNAVDKCIVSAAGDEAKARCFLQLGQEKMCQIHRSRGPNCTRSCIGNDVPTNPLPGYNCFAISCNSLPEDDRREGENCVANICTIDSTNIGIDCYNAATSPQPMINCTYHDIPTAINYNYDTHQNLNNAYYLGKFFTGASKTASDGRLISLNHDALEKSNFAIDSLGIFPNYMEHPSCDGDITSCIIDCNYVTPGSDNAMICDLSQDQDTVIIPIASNPNFDFSNEQISHNIHYDVDNDWFYKPYPLVDKGSTNDNNRQFRNIVKWNNFISWGENYNGSLFEHSEGSNLIIARGDLDNNHQTDLDNHHISRGAHFDRLCMDFGHLKDLDIINQGEVVAKTASIAAISGAVVVAFCATPFIGAACANPLVPIGIFGASFDRLINEFNFDKFISPSNCGTARFGIRNNHLGSSNISGYHGSSATDGDREHYNFQYDEVNFDDNLKNNNRFMSSPFFAQEFLNEEHFREDHVFIANDEESNLAKIVLSKDGYIKGDVVTEYHRNYETHRVRACMRFDGGARSCNVSCTILGCIKQRCGYDQCVDLYVNSNDPYKCSVAKTTVTASGTIENKSDDDFKFGDNDDYESNHYGLAVNDKKFCAKEITSEDIFSTASSGVVRLRAVIYPDRYICVFADGKHDGKWHIRSMIPHVSIPYITLSAVPGTKPFWGKRYCLRYGMKSDNTSSQNQDNCTNDTEAQGSCAPILQAATSNMNDIDNNILQYVQFNSQISLNHIGIKKAMFESFKSNLIDNVGFTPYFTPENGIFETDFFNPSIVAHYGSELAVTELQQGCIGGYDSNSGNTPCLNNDYPSVDFPDEFFAMEMDGPNRVSIKHSNDGILKLKSNQYNDLSGMDYEKLAYIKKGFNGGYNYPILTLYNSNGTAISDITIFRKKPNYDNILLNYDDSGVFSLRLRDDSEIANNIADDNLRLSPVDLTIHHDSNSQSIPPSLEWIDDQQCFPLDSNDDRANLEYMKFCLKEDSCSDLFDKCLKDNLFATSLDERSSLWNECFGGPNSLINQCSAKWGINNNLGDKDKINDIIDFMQKSRDNHSDMANNSYYGWHHEICLNSDSYNNINVATYNSYDENIEEKCILDPVINGNATINVQETPDDLSDDIIVADNFSYNNGCESGGNERILDDQNNKCSCLKQSDPYWQQKLAIIPDDIIPLNDNNLKDIKIRIATSRELGLCFDRALPLQCNGNITASGDYAARTTAVASTRNAEYGHIFLPFEQFETGSIAYGNCVENWKDQTGTPMMRCVVDSGGNTNFEDIKIRVNLTINNLSDGGNIYLFDDDNSRRLNDINGNQLPVISRLFKENTPAVILNPDSDNIIATISNISTRSIDVTFDSDEPIDVTAIEINRSLQGFCSRPKCDLLPPFNEPYYILNNSLLGGRYPDYIERNTDATLYQKGSEAGYAYWNSDDRNIIASDVDQDIFAEDCFVGFESSGSLLPKKTCNPEGEITIAEFTPGNVINACVRKTCNIIADNELINVSYINDQLQGTNFTRKNLDSSQLKASRSNSVASFDFGVTNLNERSVILGSCYYDLARGLNYINITSGTTGFREPYLICKSDGNVTSISSNLDGVSGNLTLINGDVCERASCAGRIAQESTYIITDAVVGYNDGQSARYSESDNGCPSNFQNYPYNIQLSHNVSDVSNIDDDLNVFVDDDLDIFVNNGIKIIEGGNKPIRNCHITNNIEINQGQEVDEVEWSRSDNPCISKCIGANDFQDIGSTDANDIVITASSIIYNGSFVYITIDANLKDNPPQIIKFADNSGHPDIILSEYSQYIYFSYPKSTADDQVSPAQITKIIINNEAGFFPTNLSSSDLVNIELVNRINVGITEHNVSTGAGGGSKTIKIEWNSASFGENQYAYFTSSSEQALNQDPLNNGVHYDIYSTNCGSRGNCGAITISNNLPNGYFVAPRSDGKFLVGRKCNNNGIWSEIDQTIDDNSDDIANYRDPNTAKDRANPLVAAKGTFDDGKKIITSPSPVEAGDVIASRFYNNLNGSNLIINVNNNLVNPVAEIANNAGYNMASSDGSDKKYSIKMAKYEDGQDGNIDKLSLFEIDNNNLYPNVSGNNYVVNINSEDLFSATYEAQSYPICNADGSYDTGDSTTSATILSQYYKGQSITYDRCAENNTKINQSHMMVTCNDNGNWDITNNDNCRADCILEGYQTPQRSSTHPEHISGVDDVWMRSFLYGMMHHNGQFSYRYIIEVSGGRAQHSCQVWCNDGNISLSDDCNYIRKGRDDTQYRACGWDRGVENEKRRLFQGACVNCHVDNPVHVAHHEFHMRNHHNDTVGGGICRDYNPVWY